MLSSTSRKLNLGCGFDHREGWVNADNFAECEPDLLFDIEQAWPFPTSSFDYVLMKHVLEHVGATFDVFQSVMRELHRVMAPDAVVEIHVPHVRHDTFWSDPTHVRAFTPLTFEMMSKRRNREWIARRVNSTMIAIIMDVDFEVMETVQVYEQPWREKLARGEITLEQVRIFADERWNVARELQVKLRAVK
jgi:predicted SAM-dependent methyltransferase